MFVSAVAHADNFPMKPITLIVPFPPAGIIDILTRSISPGLSQRLGQAVVIENRPGAGGNIGAALAAKSLADGYTIFMGLISTHAINQTLYKNLPYDPIRDFQPLSLVAKAPLILLVNPTVPATSTRELIAYAKANPGRLNFASAGNGSASHIAMAMFASMAHISLTHVPYRGSAPMMNDLAAGQIPMAFDGLPTALPQIQSGTIRALASATATRPRALPDLPTVQEQGVKGYECYTWNAIFAPAKTPAPIVAKLVDAMQRSLADPVVIKRLQDTGVDPTPDSNPEKLAAFVKAELAKWAPIVKASGAQLD